MAVEAAVTFLLDTLKELIGDQAGLLAGAKHELVQLKSEFELLKIFLKEASHSTNNGEVFEGIARQAREVVYDIEDILESCLFEAASKTKRSIPITKCCRNLSLAQQVRSIRKGKVIDMYHKAKNELDNMRNRQLVLSPADAQDQSRTTFNKDPIIRRDKLVGLEDAEKTITGYLMETTDELDVICITGMGGLGKTTLAGKIYDSPAVKHKLGTRVWVIVSGKFNKRDIFLSILSQITSADNSGMSEEGLGEAVRGCLQDEKFLIIFDDVWGVNDWDAIKNVLPMTNPKGKVVITTREETVGAAAGARVTYKLRFLGEDESWKLLQLEVFDNVHTCPEDLAIIGEQIAHKCDGLPLAISMIGGILRGRNTMRRPIGVIESEWNKVFENMPQYLKRGKVPEVVALSYERLPDELRECFLYMGVFPEDHVVPSWELTRLWIAEGFIKKKEQEHESLEETAEWYLNELINRSLLIVGKINAMGQVKACRVHDAVRSFCISKAAELGVFKEIRDIREETTTSTTTAFDDEEYSSSYHRRLCLHSDPSTTFPHNERVSRGGKVRSFLSFYKKPAVLGREYLDAFNLLRVLYSNSIRFSVFPEKTTRLMHLRYITLDVVDLKILPEDLCHLSWLQTLLVQTKPDNIITVKANIWSMIRLRHLKTNAAIVLVHKINYNNNDDQISSRSLQTLSNLSTESCTVSVSERASGVRRMGIHGDVATLLETNCDFLKKLRGLEKLKLVNKSDALQGLPLHDRFPPNLKRLTLSNTCLKWSHVSKLASIATLEVLKLKDNAFTGITWRVAGHQEFPRLQFLLIADADLVSWEASDVNFPNLTCLSLNKCENLKEIPRQLVEKLQKLDMHRVRRSAYEPAKELVESQNQSLGHQRGRWATRLLQLSVGDLIS